MATWNKIYDLTALFGIDFFATHRNIATDGTFIYYYGHTGTLGAAGTGIYRYNSILNTDTLIVAYSSFLDDPSDDRYIRICMATFKGSVYIGASYFNSLTYPDKVVVYKLSGSSLVNVFQVDDVSLIQIYADNDKIVGLYDDGVDIRSPYSSNGTSWINLGPPVFNTGNGPDGLAVSRDFRESGIYEDNSSREVYKFAGSSWTKQGVAMPSGSRLVDNKATLWITRMDGYEYTNDFSTYNIPSFVDDIYMAIQLNMPWPMSHAFNFGTNEEDIYYFDGVNWILDGSAPSPPFWGRHSSNVSGRNWFIRLDNGECYAFVRGTLASTTCTVWKRDADLDPTPDSWGGSCESAVFYYGVDTLIERGTLPFCSVNPGAMAITELFVAVVGNADPATSNSETAYAVYPYDVFADMTVEIAPEAVVSVKNV